MSTKPKFAILRVKKLKKPSNVQSAINHNRRKFDIAAPNADSSLSHKNVYLGSSNPLEYIKRLHQKLGIVPRKNAVYANEILLTFRPEHMDDATPQDIQKWFKKNTKWLREKYGVGLASVDLHMDETTPHIQAIVTPVYQTDQGEWRLAAKHFFDKPLLRKLQTEYAKQMEEFGLERGVKGSKAKHETIKRHYGVLKETEKAANQLFEKHMQDLGEPERFSFLKAKQFAASMMQYIDKLKETLKDALLANEALKNKYDNKIYKAERRIKKLEEAVKLSPERIEELQLVESKLQTANAAIEQQEKWTDRQVEEAEAKASKYLSQRNHYMDRLAKYEKVY